jgi:hypothetical protein
VKSAALIAAVGLVLAFVAWRIFRTPAHVAAPPPIFTVNSIYEGVRVVNASGLKAVQVLGTGSMEPHIPPHPLGKGVIVAVAGIDQTPFEALVEGDYVNYRAASGDTLHKLGQRTERGFVVFGTANEVSDDQFVTASNYLGRVAVVYRLP